MGIWIVRGIYQPLRHLIPSSSSQLSLYMDLKKAGTVNLQQAVARQFNLIEEHATRLRPVELGRAFGSCEVWVAPGDTEQELSNNNPNIRLEKMERYADGCEDVSSKEVGLNLEVVTNRGAGFFVERNEDGMVPPHLL